MAILKSEFSDMSIEVVIDKIRAFIDSDNKWIYFISHDGKWIYYTVRVRHKNMEMMNPKIMRNEFSGAFDTIFRLPKIIRESIKNHEIRVIETEMADFGKFVVFPSDLFSFHENSACLIEQNLFNFGYWVAEMQYCKDFDNKHEDGKIMFTLEVEDEALLKFADEIEMEYKKIESEAIPV